MKFASLFSGIGGFELGLAEAGHEPVFLCEILPEARHVLEKRLPGVHLAGDISAVEEIPADADLVTAGFPCQDLSQAGRTVGVTGPRSGLISEVFRLIRGRKPQWVAIENVPFMLQLKRGEAIQLITRELEALGYRWAWRVVDTFGFGLPQRRERVFIVAALNADPACVLLSDEAQLQRPVSAVGAKAHGFYWTEGRTGLGWAADAVPTLKNGSSIGIPSPPAILLPNGDIIKPDIRDAERLQGFPADWTLPAAEAGRASLRWSLVGSAVSVPVAAWLGRALAHPGDYDTGRDRLFDPTKTLPRAARFDGNKRYAVEIGADPLGVAPIALADFLLWPGVPLSLRASASFLDRTRRAKLRFQPRFIESVESYVAGLRDVIADKAA